MDKNQYSLVGILIYILAILILGIGSSPPITVFLVAVLPSLAVVILGLLWRAKDQFNLVFHRGVPIIAAMVGFVAFSLPKPWTLSQIDAIPLAITNLLLSIIVLDIIFFEEVWGSTEEKKKEPKQESAPIQSMQQVLQSLESNCKAVNFVIGRVYTRRNGAGAALRTRIKFQSEVYNELSDALAAADMDRIYNATQQIYAVVELLHKTENEVFGRVDLKNLERDSLGNSRIIDVLAHNDNDPVLDYVNQIVQTCHQLVK